MKNDRNVNVSNPEELFSVDNLRKVVNYDYFKNSLNYYNTLIRYGKPFLCGKIEISFSIFLQVEQEDLIDTISGMFSFQLTGISERKLKEIERSIEIPLTFAINGRNGQISYLFQPTDENDFYSELKLFLTEMSKYLIPVSPLRENTFIDTTTEGVRNSASFIGDLDIKKLILKPSGDDLDLEDLVLDNISRELVLNLLKLIENKKIVKEQGGKLPKGYIFRGKPGLGKTSIMKALTKKASEKIVIFSITRKDYTSAWVGEGERRIAELLKAIQKYGEKENVHCIIFFDEFESIGRKREDTHEVHATELNELLRFLDGLSSSDNITFIAGTNAEIADLDLAITRGGRCNDIIEFKEPDKDLINQYLTKRLKSLLEKGIFSSEIIEDENIFSECLGFSYADLNTIITDLINKRALDFLLGKNYAIDAKMFKEKILEYKKNKGIGSNNKIGFI